MKRYFLPIIFLLTLSMSLAACGGGLRDDISCRELGDAAAGAVDSELSVAGDEQLFLIFGESEPYDDYALFASTPTDDIDEIGIFHGKSPDDAEAMTELLEKYVSETADGMRSFVMSYAPDEAKKLDTARAFSVGNYAVYLILDKRDCEAVTARIEEYLSKK